MFENERIVCEFLRKVAPSREWEYLGEVEHYWIGELCDELNKQLKAENATLRQQLADVTESMGRVEERCAKLREYIERKQHLQDFARLVTENAKLREKIKALTELASIGKLTASQCTELAEDNTKLRELCADIYEMAYHEFPSAFKAAFADRMRELGVEVD